uniref:Zinc finger protein (TRAF/RING)-4 n=1 Tax=Phallusia mammillata TaxID=59560 RepID=A0A6F9DAW9_9ASCI|nr:zinc finger protein (TRAF/RING)-4 [Phallusia mammillata]
MAQEMTSSEIAAVKHLQETSEHPPHKKQKMEKVNTSAKRLEDRLNHILSCSVCLDLPISTCMQCCHGHLMCVACFHHLLADARLKDEPASCPSCRVEISRGSCTRNLAVEKAISELPTKCATCGAIFPRSSIAAHEKHECSERIVTCRFKELGCVWSGPAHELSNHFDNCVHPHKSPNELLQCLNSIKDQHSQQVSLLHNITNLLSCENIAYTEVQLQPYRTDDFVTKLFYASNRFHLLGQAWVLKAYVSAVERHPSNPTVSADRKLSFQLQLKSKVSEAMDLDVLLLKAPYEKINVTPKLFHATFASDRSECEQQLLETDDVNRMLGSKYLNVRLFMFHQKH